MVKPKHAWMIRAGNENELADIVQEENIVTIGWDSLDNVSDLNTREQFKQRYRDANPEDSPGRVAVNAGQVYRFAREIQQGDYVLTYIKPVQAAADDGRDPSTVPGEGILPWHGR